MMKKVMQVTLKPDLQFILIGVLVLQTDLKLSNTFKTFKNDMKLPFSAGVQMARICSKLLKII